MSGLTAKGAATRARLLAAARDAIAGDGVLEVAPVSSAAGVAPSVLYRYFGSKDGLVEAVVHAFYDEYDAELLAADLAPDATWDAREALRLRREV
ncbi:MAG: regulatory protein TetR, partial [Solirubrobacterales bacterium]|nr:regulatory protein TetR [Solirubrobacterales bacterium]